MSTLTLLLMAVHQIGLVRARRVSYNFRIFLVLEVRTRYLHGPAQRKLCDADEREEDTPGSIVYDRRRIQNGRGSRIAPSARESVSRQPFISPQFFDCARANLVLAYTSLRSKST